MKRIAIVILYIFVISGMLLASIKSERISYKKQNLALRHKIEPDNPIFKSPGHPVSPIVYPTSRTLGFSSTLIDSSMNGYGMILPSTRPLVVNGDNMFFVYRQWAGAQETSGQIGGAYSNDGLNWSVYDNFNSGTGLGRYPSASGNADYPYAFWNEYSGPSSEDTDGRAYYAFDEFGWDGESMSTAYEVDLIWTNNKATWVGSPDYSYKLSTGEHMYNVGYSDWERDNKYLFHSEAYVDGLIIFGSEIKIFDIVNDMVGGNDEGSYSSNITVDVNEAGIGYAAISTYFLGGDVGTSPYANSHTFALKKTENYGETWTGDQEESGYYYIPDFVFDDMFATETFPDSIYFECTDTTYVFDELFCSYDFDLRVDSDGNPHIITGIVVAGGTGVYTSITPAVGYYHFWIDKDNLSSPGTTNTPTGWNYSMVASAQDSWRYDDHSGWQDIFPSLAISEESDNIMWVASSMATEGPADIDDMGTPADSCDDEYSYPEWSVDVYLFRSEDGGVTWDLESNLTNTPDPDPDDEDSPEEAHAHLSATGATNNSVWVVYQMPDFIYGSTTGDAGYADYKNRLFAGKYTRTTTHTDETIEMPNNYRLEQAYPNPFNPMTNIQYTIAYSGDVSLVIYDLMGHEIKTLVSGYHDARSYSIEWNGLNEDGNHVPSGIYFYRLSADNFSQVNKVMLLK